MTKFCQSCQTWRPADQFRQSQHRRGSRFMKCVVCIEKIRQSKEREQRERTATAG